MRRTIMVTSMCLATAVLPCGAEEAKPVYENAAAPVESRVEDLAGRLNLEEKISLLSGKTGSETMDIPRLGIPSLKVIDGPHGIGWGTDATCFPSGISMGSCWNTELIAEVGRALARETRGAGRHVLLGPCIGIHRTPLGGRNFESFGEDPYQVGRIGVAYVNGVQSEKIGTSIKHYVCNNQEWERTTISSELSERALREIYLPHFRMIVEEAQPWSIMAAYNKVRGLYCCANPYILNDILKKEFGFKGFIVSDWGAVHGTVDSANAGLDLEMPGPGKYFNQDLLTAVQTGEVSEAVIDDKIRRLLRVMFLAGLFDKPDPSLRGMLNAPEHHALARRLAEEAIVLLKNDQAVLPLDIKAIKSIAVIGPNAAAYRAGGGSSGVKAVDPVTPLQGLKAKCGHGATVGYAEGCSVPLDLEVIPADQLRPAGGKPGERGLRAEYFANKDLAGEPVLTRIDETVDFRWQQESPAPGIPADGFSVRWTGTFTPVASGTYEFGMTTDDGFRVFVDGKPLIDRWQDQSAIMRTAAIQLEAGRTYAIRAEYYESTGEARARLGWIPAIEKLLRDAVELARQSDVAIVFAGLSERFEGARVDRENMDLPGRQAELIREVARANPRTIVVLINGTPVTMSDWIDGVPAVVEAWYPAQKGGDAIANILFGDVNPSGKLPVTFPKKIEDNPSFGRYPGAKDVVEYAEGIYVGYRHYDTKNIEPQFPFGHGLSYTAFEYSDLAVDSKSMTVSCKVKNTGKRAGKEVVQLYVHDVESSLDRPPSELKRFEKVDLKPGESKSVTFTLDDGALAFYDPSAGKWVVEPGDFEMLIGSSSRDIRLKGILTR